MTKNIKIPEKETEHRTEMKSNSNFILFFLITEIRRIVNPAISDL